MISASSSALWGESEGAAGRMFPTLVDIRAPEGPCLVGVVRFVWPQPAAAGTAKGELRATTEGLLAHDLAESIEAYWCFGLQTADPVRYLYLVTPSSCPKCRSDSLRPLAALEAHVGAGTLPLCCDRCGGFWLKRAAVMPLHESGALEEIDADHIMYRDLDKKNGLCPEAHGILSRAKVAWYDPYYVERCSKCGGIWLDAGEWRRLTEEDLIEHLDDLFEPAWRKHLIREQGRLNLRETLSARLGEDLLSQLETLAANLATHQDASLALAFLRQTVRTHRRRNVRESVDIHRKLSAETDSLQSSKTGNGT